MIYLIGSLRNERVPIIANAIRESVGVRVFDDWYASGPEADDKWREYEQQKGHSFRQALTGPFAWNAFTFDRRHILCSKAVVLVLPCGKSGHMELGWALGKGIPGYILLDNPERWDMMYLFANKVLESEEELIEVLKQYGPDPVLPEPSLSPAEHEAMG